MEGKLTRGWARVSAALRSRPLAGIAASLAIHVALVLLAVWLAGPTPRFAIKPGEPLVVELPPIPEPPPPGNPAARTLGSPEPAKPQAKSPPPGRSQAPAPRAAPAAPPSPAPVPAAPPSPAPASPPPAVASRSPEQPTPEPRRVPAEPPAPARQPAPAEPAPQRQATAEPPRPAPEPPSQSRAALPEPTPAPPRPAPAAPAPAPPAREPAPSETVVREFPFGRPAPPSEAAQRPADSQPTPPREATRAAAGGSPGSAPGARGGSPGGSGPQVAALPPGREAPPVDIRSALGRGAGAGGRGGGWGGILGDPIPLDSTDPKFSDWLELIRRAIQSNMTFPCVKDPLSLRCEPRDAKLVVMFGITREGRLQAIEVMRSSGFTIYDDNSVTAIKLAAPFPPVPAAVMATRPWGATGIPITAFFTYVVTTWTQTIVR